MSLGIMANYTSNYKSEQTTKNLQIFEEEKNNRMGKKQTKEHANGKKQYHTKCKIEEITKQLLNTECLVRILHLKATIFSKKEASKCPAQLHQAQQI